MFAWFGRNIGKVVGPFAPVVKQEVLPYWIFVIMKVKSEEIGCVFGAPVVYKKVTIMTFVTFSVDNII